MPLAKSVPQPQETQEVENYQKPEQSVLTHESLPLDMYRIFNENINHIRPKDISKLKEIYHWAVSKCDEPSLGNIMLKISRMEDQLGAPAHGEKRYDKLWRFVHISRKMDDLDKQRESLRKRWVI